MGKQVEALIQEYLKDKESKCTELESLIRGLGNISVEQMIRVLVNSPSINIVDAILPRIIVLLKKKAPNLKLSAKISEVKQEWDKPTLATYFPKLRLSFYTATNNLATRAAYGATAIPSQKPIKRKPPTRNEPRKATAREHPDNQRTRNSPNIAQFTKIAGQLLENLLVEAMAMLPTQDSATTSNNINLTKALQKFINEFTINISDISFTHGCTAARILQQKMMGLYIHSKNWDPASLQKERLLKIFHVIGILCSISCINMLSDQATDHALRCEIEEAYLAATEGYVLHLRSTNATLRDNFANFTIQFLQLFEQYLSILLTKDSINYAKHAKQAKESIDEFLVRYLLSGDSFTAYIEFNCPNYQSAIRENIALLRNYLKKYEDFNIPFRQTVTRIYMHIVINLAAYQIAMCASKRKLQMSLYSMPYDGNSMPYGLTVGP